MSSLETWQGKAEATADVGDGLDRELEQATAKVEQIRGGQHAFRVAAGLCNKLAQHAEKDRDEGKLDLEACGEIKKWIGRCAEACLNMAEQSKVQELVASGEVEALKRAVGFVQKHHDTAAARVRHFQAQDLEDQTSEGNGKDHDPPEEFIGRRRARSAGERPERGGDVDKRRAAARKAPKKKAAKKTAKKKATKKPTRKKAKR